MNKLITIIFSVIIFEFMFISCDDKKDKNTAKETFPYYLVMDREEYQPVVMYTNKEIIADQKEIEKYRYHLMDEYDKTHKEDEGGIHVIKDFGNFIFDDNLIEPLYKSLVAIYYGANTVLITGDEYSFQMKGCNTYQTEFENSLSKVKKENGIIYWESKDTTFASIVRVISGERFYNSYDECERTIYVTDFDSLVPLQNQISIRDAPYYFKKSCVYLVEDKNGIYIPHFTMLYKNATYIVAYKVNNIPVSDRQIMARLSSDDTLIIQTSKLYLLKKTFEVD